MSDVYVNVYACRFHKLYESCHSFIYHPPSGQVASKVCQDLCLFVLFLLAFTIVVLAAHSSESALLVSRVKDFIETLRLRLSISDVRNEE